MAELRSFPTATIPTFTATFPTFTTATAAATATTITHHHHVSRQTHNLQKLKRSQHQPLELP